MPLIFGLLVILNAVFLAWQFFEKQNTSQSAAVAIELPGERLKLLSETPVSQRGEVAPESSSTSTKSSGDASSFCYRIGPISSNDMLEQLRNALTKSGFEVKAEVLSDDQASFLVYIPSLASRDRADVMAGELSSKGFDASVINDPQFANSVSLGVFTSQAKADVLKSKMRELGYQAEIRQSTSVRQEQWLRVDSAGSSGRTQIDRIISGTPYLRREPAACEI
jgi:cell division protein FtsN